MGKPKKNTPKISEADETEDNLLLIVNSTQVPNVFLDRVMAVATDAIFKCLMCVTRQTYGWRKKWDAISTTQIEKLTGLSNRSVIDNMAHLREAGLVIRRNNVENPQWGLEYSLNTKADLDKASAISRGLKGLAKDMNCPVVALSQLSRAPENRTGDNRPRLADLRDSGEIEQDADVVAFIFREEVYKPKDQDLLGKAELILAKQRNGPTGTIHLTFLHRSTSFENAAQEGMAAGA